MSMTTTSRASLADVIGLISQANLSELRSAVRTVARLVDGEPANIAADPAGLRRCLEMTAPQAHGISRGVWANIRSLLRKSLGLVRPMMAGRSVQPILPAWQVLTVNLPFSRSVRLLPVLRFLSARGRDPTDVTMADLEDYREAIFNDRLRKDPEKSWGQLVWVWNWSRREVDGWPAVIIERPSRRVTYVLPWSVFPTSFKHDVYLFLERLSGKDLSEDGPPRPARPSTLQKRAYQLRLAASALIHRGHKADTVRSIADLLSLERYQGILRFFLDRHGGKTSQQVADMAAFLKDVARHWIKIDSSILEKMKKISSRLDRKSTRLN